MVDKQDLYDLKARLIYDAYHEIGKQVVKFCNKEKEDLPSYLNLDGVYLDAIYDRMDGIEEYYYQIRDISGK